jgi:hypothetical protein
VSATYHVVMRLIVALGVLWLAGCASQAASPPSPPVDAGERAPRPGAAAGAETPPVAPGSPEPPTAQPELSEPPEPVGEGPPQAGTGRKGPQRERLFDLDVRGPLAPELVRRIVGAQKPRIRQCYRQARIAKPKLAGRLEMALEVDTLGRTTKVSATKSLDLGLDACVAKVLEAVRFAAPDKLVRATFALYLAPSIGPKGTMKPTLVQGVMRGAVDDVRRCYERQLTKMPGLSGKVTVKLVIAADGTVSWATVKKGIHPEVDRCIETVISRLIFPRPSGGAVLVSYPFILKAR